MDFLLVEDKELALDAYKCLPVLSLQAHLEGVQMDSTICQKKEERSVSTH